MAHFPKPFFRKPRQRWYVQLGGCQINLGPDRDEAFRRYHELMASESKATATCAAASVRASAPSVQLVVVVIDAFLDNVQLERSPDTYRWYKDRLQRFVEAVPGDLSLTQLKPLHVRQWIDAMTDVSSGTRRNYCRAVQRAMKWAEEQGYIDRSPLANLRKPRGGKREQVVSSQEFTHLLAATKDEEFKNLLTMTWETGCRPQELLRVEARHVDVINSRWVFPASEAKGGRLPRIVYLTPLALEVTKTLVERYPVGPLFRNTDGVPWTPDACNCRFATLRKKLGKRYCLYALRHTWMNRLLLGGVDSLTVAVLAGHSDPSTLAKTYQHLSQNPSFLQEQARRVAG